MRRWLWGVLPLALATQGCGAECVDVDPDGVRMRLEVPGQSVEYFAHPWPSNALLKEGGGMRLQRWPNPTGSSTLDDYKAVIAETTDAFSRNAAIYMSFTGGLDPASLPSGAMDATADGASLFLVDVDPDSPQRGLRVPLSVRFSADATLYLPENHLIALPPFGVSLRPGTTYALVGTSGLQTSSGEPLVRSAHLANGLSSGACAEQAPDALRSMLAPLTRWLAEVDLSADDVVAATVFTTQDAVAELREIADVARQVPLPEVTGLTKVDERPEVMLVRGIIEMPGFQAGKLPFVQAGDGGEIHRDANGKPAVHHTETTRVGFMLPRGRPMPAGGWPVVLAADGTGSNYRSMYNDVRDGVPKSTATQLANLGIATVSYDPTLHGPRDPTSADERLTFFNLFNIIAGRDNIRQGAVDCVIMTRLIKSGLEIPGAVTGEGAVRFNPNKVAFLGHSQGGLVGAPCLTAESSFRSAVFSGTSGIMTITLLERKDPVDFLALLTRLLQLPADEPLDDMHPVLNLIQTFIEPADPIAYGPSLLADPPDAAPTDLLFVEGFLDSASPARGHEALASAAGIPLVAPHHRVPAAQSLIGPPPQEAPARENVMVGGSAVTVGLIQYPQRDHWPIFTDFDASARYIEFLRSSLLEGRAQIIASSRP